MSNSVQLKLTPAYPLDLIDSYRESSFMERVLSEARGYAYRSGGVPSGNGTVFSSDEQLAGIQAIREMPGMQAVLVALGKEIRRCIADGVIEPAPNADLTTADIEVLERAFTAIGAELERRKEQQKAG